MFYDPDFNCRVYTIEQYYRIKEVILKRKLEEYRKRMRGGNNVQEQGQAIVRASIFNHSQDAREHRAFGDYSKPRLPHRSEGFPEARTAIVLRSPEDL